MGRRDATLLIGKINHDRRNGAYAREDQLRIPAHPVHQAGPPGALPMSGPAQEASRKLSTVAMTA
jgi:hypothetical protein